LFVAERARLPCCFDIEAAALSAVIRLAQFRGEDGGC
jgi:hypothetical protein